MENGQAERLIKMEGERQEDPEMTKGDEEEQQILKIQIEEMVAETENKSRKGGMSMLEHRRGRPRGNSEC